MDRLNLVPVDGPKAMSQLEPVEFRWVVAGRDHHATVDAVVNPGEIKHRRNDRSDVDDVAAACRQPLHDRVPDPGRTLPVVTADNYRDMGDGSREPRSNVGRITSGDRPGYVRCDIAADNATDVVFAKDAGVDAYLHCD